MRGPATRPERTTGERAISWPRRLSSRRSARTLLAAETATEATHALQRDGDQRGAAAMRARASLLVDACESAHTPALVTSESPIPLTSREREICTLAATGASSPEIASKLFLSVRTVNNHLQRAYAKLGVTNRRELAAVLDRIP